MTVPRTISRDRLSRETREEIEAIVTAAVPAVAPAVALAVWQAGRHVYEAAFGWADPESKRRPAAPELCFDLASVSKLFTATCFLAMASEGRVALDDAVVSVITELGGRNPRSVDGGQEPLTRAMLPTPAERVGWLVDPARVTFRQLLSHTSGLAPWRAVFEACGPAPPPPDQPDPVSVERRRAAGLSAVCGYPFVDRPGRAIGYSDLGFMLLGEAVLRLTLVPLDDAIRDRVTSPLGLGSVVYAPLRAGLSKERIAPTSVDELWRGRRCWGEAEDENAAGLGGVAGHAGLFGNVGDVARFGRAWLERDPRLGITPALMDEAVREQACDAGQRRGLGWQLRPATTGAPPGSFLAPLSKGSFGHTGFTGISIAVDPERELVVVCLTNRVYAGRTNPGIDELRIALHAAVARA